MRTVLIVPTASFALACGGLFDDAVHLGQDARDPIRWTSGTLPPSSATELRYTQSTGIDWINNGQFQAPRADATAWFQQIAFKCDQSTTTTPDLPASSMQFMAYVGKGWTVPTDGKWTVKACENTGPNGPNFEVGLREGDPAWVWITAYSM